jgi:tetratricopeptide (TPR) repeat protein
MNRYFAPVLAGLLLLAGCAQGLHRQADEGPQVLIVDTPAPPESPLYGLMVGEIAAQRGDYQVGLERYYAAARAERDPRLAERATHFGLYTDDHALALDAARLWRELAPENRLVVRIIANLELRLGNVEGGLAELRAFLAGEPELGEAFAQLTALLVRLPDKAVALEVAGRLTADYPTQAEAHFAHGAVARHAARLGLAESEMAEAVRLRPDWVQARANLAQVQVALGHHDAALETLSAGVEAVPESRDLRLAYARLLMNRGRVHDARAQFKAVSEANPGDPDILYALALLSLETRQFDEAESYFLELEKGNGRGDDARFFLGRLEAQRENFDAALAWYEKVAGGEYVDEAMIQVAAVLARQGRLGEALERVRELRDIKPQLRVRLLLVEGELLADADRENDAMSLYDAALAETPDSDDLLYARAMLAERLDRLDLLEQDLRTLIERDPANASALNALGYTLADRTSRFDEALELIRRAFEIRPEDAAIIDSLGWVHYRLGDREAALNYLRDAYARSQAPEIAAHLGEVLWVTGDQARAREIFEEALRVHPDNEVLRRAVDRFAP